MKRRDVILSLSGLAGPTVLEGCGGSKPPRPTALSLTLTAASDINPGPAGAARPLRISIFNLTGTAALSQADFFTCGADPAKTLGPDLLALDDTTLKPAQTDTLTREAKPDVKFIDVVGSVYAIDKARWRAWGTAKPHAANGPTVKLNTTAENPFGPRLMVRFTCSAAL